MIDERAAIEWLEEQKKYFRAISTQPEQMLPSKQECTERKR